MADTEKRNVVIKQKLENKIVELYPQTESNIVANNSNITGSTVTNVFNNALPLEGSEHINIVPSENGGIKIDFTGSLAPNVTVQGSSAYYNPVEVTGGLNPEKTAATYTVEHKMEGPLARYTSKNETTTIGEGESKTIKIPQLEVDQFGHVRTAADEDVTITIPSTTNMVTGTGLTDNKIILGNVDSKIKTSPYGIITSSNTKNIDDTYIPTSLWIENRINKKITEGAQYLGLVNGHDYNTGRLTYKENESSPTTYIVPNSQGDWVRAVKQFSVPYDVNGNGPSETAHVGDILIYHGKSAGDMYLWDVIHTEVDTDTWRPIQVKGTDIGSSTTLNLTEGDNVSLSNSSGTVTISAKDTTYKLGQNPGALNTVTLTPSINSGSVQVVTINNVANATTAETANKIANSLIVKFDTGDKENTNLFTYNGTEEKTIRISPVAIGAAQDDHDHGQINNDGKMRGPGTTIGEGDTIVFIDGSDYSKIKHSSIAFGANNDANKTIALTKAGTWATFLQANQNITINSGLKHKNKPSDPPVYIKGTPNGTEPTLGKSGIDAGIYSTVEVNEQGIAIAGSQVIKYYAPGTTNDTIKGDTMLAQNGFAFVEIA